MRGGAPALLQKNTPVMATNQSPYDILNRCIHCGMCLQSCPTYALTGLEISSPRGRIRLMKSVAEDKLPITEKFVDEMYFCLDCQACETVCPAGVRYGTLVENARHIVAQAEKDPPRLKFVKMFLNTVLVSKRRLRVFAKLMRLYERSGLREAVERSGILSVFSPNAEVRHALLPTLHEEPFDENVDAIRTPARGAPIGRVGFLTGCIMNHALPEVHRDAVEVLRACGFEVVIPQMQECCGSLHGHNGEVETARILARKNLDVFERHDFDYFVVDSAGCGAFLKEYGTLFADDARYAEKAKEFSAKVNDITEFLTEVYPEKELFWAGLPPLQSLKQKVTYHEACHLVHTQKISTQPRKLIQSIPGIEFVELPEATWCCGSAGIYNVVRFEDSMRLLERKMQNLASTGAEIVVTANPGCHLQLQYGIKAKGLKMEVVHPVQLVKRALEITSS
jgi:glycolate oxidase iron-sulfur subunit